MSEEEKAAGRIGRPPKEPLLRFFANIVAASDGCWIWQGAGDKNGYGRLATSRNAKGQPVMTRAHRFAYVTFIGDIPDGLFVCHECDNPRCVNPMHLWLGTNKDNVHDSMRKGRSRVRGKSRLPVNLIRGVADLLARGWHERDIAKAVGVSKGTVYNVRHRIVLPPAPGEGEE